MEQADGLSLDNVPARIKSFRQQFNLSQADLATLVGKTPATIIRWEDTGPGENTPLVVLALTLLYMRLQQKKTHPPRTPEVTV